jgi:hypothetical protein
MDSLSGQTFDWIQPTLGRRLFRLERGTGTVATLEFVSPWGTVARARSERGRWVFQKKGLLRSRVIASLEDGVTEVGTFLPRIWRPGGTLELPDGRRYDTVGNFLRTRYQVLDPGGFPLLEYRRTGFLRTGGTMTLAPAGAQLRDLPWLMLFGWYLVVLSSGGSAREIN